MQKKNNSPTKASNYDKFPVVQITDQSDDCIEGYDRIFEYLNRELDKIEKAKKILIIDCYSGIIDSELIHKITTELRPQLFEHTHNLMYSPPQIQAIKQPFLGDHPIFGRMNNLELIDFFDQEKLKSFREIIAQKVEGTIIVYGVGAEMVWEKGDILVYADLARWKIQQRMRRNEISNLGVENHDAPVSEQYKQAYFIDWRVCDKHKQQTMHKWDYVLDINEPDHPKMVSAQLMREGLQKVSRQPFRVVPFFDPGVWGGQWMKEVCDLDRSKINYAWCFDCVPEENSLLLGFGEKVVEIPSIDLVFLHPIELLGEHIYQRFGAEFPIRFDFLDTMNGGNLSLQVHPFAEYIKEEFGMDYTQDESYYMLDVEDDACVYLGLKSGIDSREMISELKNAQNVRTTFDAEKYVNKFPVKKHDHILIPAGTIHCSGKNSMVLEISATPYIFTFKLWDWGRVGMDGKPRPISIEHGEKNIAWERTTALVEKELINCVELIAEGEGWREERTGLHALEFIETRRHWFTQKIFHHTQGNLNVLNLVEGREAIVESPSQAFEPFVVHYAETFIVPASVGEYAIRPYGESEGKECATLKAFVRVR